MARLVIDAAFAKRVASALVLGAVALQFVWLGGWAYALFVALVVAVTAWEWGRLQPGDDTGATIGRIAGLLSGVVAIGAIVVAELGRPDWAIAGLLLAAAACAVAARRVHASRLASALGIVYLGLPAVAMVWLRSLPGVGLAATASLLAVIWATDIFAYLVGRSVGGPKLAPRISPGKTWSGLGGGVFGAVLVTLAALVVFARQGSFVGAVLFAGLLAVVAQIGDLFESAIKRRAGVKDSSALIPGHGGLLDRVDGLMFAAPAVALAFIVFGHEVVPW